MHELNELRILARSPDPAVAQPAIQQLGWRDADPMTTQLLIDLVTSDIEGVSKEAVYALRGLGEVATEALIDRILHPVRPEDERLLECSSAIGRPLFDLCRVLVTDGDAKRSRAAEQVVADFASELEIDEAVTIYLAIYDRERHATLPPILCEIWPRLGTPEGRAAIAARWTERGLRQWIDDRIDHEPLALCPLLALLFAGPPEAERVIRELLEPMPHRSRWIAIQSMLMVDAVRMGEVLGVDRRLREWGIGCARSFLNTAQPELELRMVVAFSDDPGVLAALLQSRDLSRHRFREVLRMTRPLRLRAAFDKHADPATKHMLILSIDGTRFTGAGTDGD